jgi:hypothetical protein
MSHVMEMSISVDDLAYLAQHTKCNNDFALATYNRITLQLYKTLRVLDLSTISWVKIHHEAQHTSFY